MFLKAVRLGEVTKRVGVDGEDNRCRLSPGLLRQWEEDCPSKETEKQVESRTEARNSNEKHMTRRRECSAWSNTAYGPKKMLTEN